MTDTTLKTIGITGQVVPLLCMLGILVLNWMERRKHKNNKLTHMIKSWKPKREIIEFGGQKYIKYNNK